MQTSNFLSLLQSFYDRSGRNLPWRQPDKDGFDAYKILVSEMMLQQTQVGRVVPKYEAFLQAFPTVQDLAAAPLSSVLAQWSGLGYNRRARYLWEAARLLQAAPRPWSFELLTACPGIGRNTAAAVLAYAYNQPVVYLETNIRTVLIHHFFEHETQVSDRELENKLQSMSDLAFAAWSPREFYWAMMDYGTYLKKTVGNLNRHSRTYARQSVFEGSRRQLRGRIIRLLVHGPQSVAQIRQHCDDDRFEEVVEDLVREKLVAFQGTMLMLYNETIKP